MTQQKDSVPVYENPHATAIADVLCDLQTTRAGLDPAEAKARLEFYGPNKTPEAKKLPWILRFLQHFNNALIYVLIVSAAITLWLNHPIDTVVILFVVFANAVIGFIQEGRAEAAMAAIENLLSPHAAVIREGERITIDAEDLVPGDVVFIEAGDRVPADMRLLEATGLKIQEAILTGESVPVEKRTDPVSVEAALGDRASMTFGGTIVAAGQAVGVVAATGSQTEIGRISGLLANVDKLQTPLLVQINMFGKWLTILILLIGAGLLGFGVFIRKADFTETFMSVVGLSVAAIPEGLPAVLTITMAIGVRAMAKQNAIVRRLPAIETLGAVSVICTDKTGTLTRNEMVVASVWTDGQTFTVSGEGYSPEGDLSPVLEPDVPLTKTISQIGLAASLCNDAALVETAGYWTVSGDPMEGALQAFAQKVVPNLDSAIVGYKRRDVLPFDASHRFMATSHGEAQNGVIFAKGAPEAILSLCKGAFHPKNGVAEIDRDQIEDAVHQLAANGQRVIALAMGTPEDAQSLSVEGLSGSLHFLGLVGMVDPPREEAVQAVADCRAAGIRVKMITGDHAATASAIAREIGFESPGRVLTGDDLDRLDDIELLVAARETNVFARTSPEHKLRLVKALQAQNQIVAMTGDGVNDAPALKRADVGVAMGKTGSAAAKEAAPMVLADDNFASIAAAVIQGRRVYDNITKLVHWTLPTGGGESSVVILALLFGLTLPITPVQILWVNLITEMTLGLALALEPLEPRTMDEPPRPRDAPLLDGTLLWDIAVATVLFAATVFGVFTYALDETGSVEFARTVAFNTLVVLQVFYLFFVRYLHGASSTLEGIKGTPAVWTALMIVVLGQLIVTYWPPAQDVFGTAALDARFSAIVIGAGVAVFGLLEVEKQMRFAVRRPSRAHY